MRCGGADTPPVSKWLGASTANFVSSARRHLLTSPLQLVDVQAGPGALAPNHHTPRQPAHINSSYLPLELCPRSSSKGSKDAVTVGQGALRHGCALIQPLVGVRRTGMNVKLERDIGGRQLLRVAKALVP